MSHGHKRRGRSSSVLVGIAGNAEDARVILVERVAGGIYGGQIALPGGKCERCDDTPLATALREAQEEIGLLPQHVRILAALDPIQSRTTGIWVHPFIAKVPEGLCFTPREGEIARVFTASAKELMGRLNRQQRLQMFATWLQPKPTECVVLDGTTIIWGLTLRILDSALPLVLSGE